MTRIVYFISAFGLTHATTAHADPSIPYIPSEWPAQVATDGYDAQAETVTRARLNLLAGSVDEADLTLSQDR